MRSSCCLVIWMLATSAMADFQRNSPQFIPFDLDPMLVASCLHDRADGSLPIVGQVHQPGIGQLHLRVTTDRGVHSTTACTVANDRFACRYPDDFPQAPTLEVAFLFIDAATAPTFDASYQAEATVIVHDSRTGQQPEFPSAFTGDLLDASGRVDAQCSEWPVMRALVNLYQHSRAARLVGVGSPTFDLADPGHLAWFKNNMTLYEFDYRDRDWSTPLGQRLDRTFWQAVWNTWFNSSNNNPIDGNDANNDPANFVPYAFANDFSDTLMLYLYRQDRARALDDNLTDICRQGLRNMANFQHRGADSFARRDVKGREHTYTDGAFHYGMFEDGRYMTEGTGWFYNPEHFDYINGGVFNARSIWALAEGLQRDATGPLAAHLRETIARGVRFCLRDALQHRYARLTENGHVYWIDAGETGYLLVGLLAACPIMGDTVVVTTATETLTLQQLTVDALDALVELQDEHGQWQLYGDKDPLVIAALCDACRLWPDHPRAVAWQQAAVKGADSWLAARLADDEAHAPCVHFASRRPTAATMSFLWEWKENDPGRRFIVFYIDGHWLQALGKLYRLTGDQRYLQRPLAITAYFCGANPWKVRLLNELGGVYNYVQDTDRDGMEDLLCYDLYPESTTFVQLGLVHFIAALQAHPSETREHQP